MNRKVGMRRGTALLPLGLLIVMLFTVGTAHATPSADPNVTTPLEFLGYNIGEDYQLTPWQAHELPNIGMRQGIVEYAHELERTSSRVRVFQYGTTEMGRPMILTVVTSPENWAQIDNLKGIVAKLADPRQVASDDEAKLLASQGKTVYWLSAGIHSTERTAAEVLVRLSYRLASDNDPWTLKLLDNVIVVMENTINPDGLEMVTDWYYRYKDTDYVSSGPPYYGKYVNHDDNRDFIGVSLAESQANVRARHQWNPTVYHDLHEAMDMLYMSPGPDPTNEAVSPITMAEWIAFAGHNLGQSAASGWKGVFTYDYADMWYPGYNHGYTYMHNSNGRFYELRGATRATPLWFTQPGRVRSWFNPMPYTAPFWWRLMDAVNLEEDAIRNDLTYTMRNKDMLLYNFYMKGKTNMQKAMSEAPYAFVIPANGGDNADVTDMINNLHVSQHIEVDRAGTAFTVGGQQFAAGDYVVRMNQPYGLTAKELLKVQAYPPIKTPYDVSAWTLGLMRDVKVFPLAENLPAGLALLPVTEAVPYAGTLTGSVSNRYVIEHGSNNNLAVALPRIWADRRMIVWQADVPFSADGRSFPAGTLLVHTSKSAEEHAVLKTMVEQLGLVAYSVSGALGDSMPAVKLRAPKVGLYTSNNSSNTTMPEGWTRMRLDRAGWDYTRLYPADVSDRSLKGYNAIIIPSMSTSTLLNGSSSSRTTPPEYRPGIGDKGVAKLKAFVENGGTLILQGRAAMMPLDMGWDIGVKTPAAATRAMQAAVESVEPEEEPDFGGRPPDFGKPLSAEEQAGAAAETLNCPPNILRIQVDPTTKVGYGYDTQEALWCETASPFFEVPAGSRAQVVASYPDDGQTLLLSGYVGGESLLRNKAAIVDAPLGKGHVILLAPNVLYRAQSTGSFMFFWNSLIEGSRTGPVSTGAGGAQ